MTAQRKRLVQEICYKTEQFAPLPVSCNGKVLELLDPFGHSTEIGSGDADLQMPQAMKLL